MTINYLENFSLYLDVDKNVSPSTISNYSKDVENFLKFCEKDVSAIDVGTVRSYIAHLSNLGRKRNTLNRVLSSLKAFFKYLRDVERVIKDSPAEEVKLQNREKSLPKAVSKSDITKLLETASAHGLKQRLVMELLYGLGGRVSEIVSLKVEDIDFEECYVRIVGKGNKERHNPIHKGCVKLLKQYMNNYGVSEGYIFPHKMDKRKHATRESVFQSVKKLAKAAGVDETTVSPHVFRHSFATHMLDNGCDMSLVQDYLGHEDIATTKIYAKVTRGNKTTNFNKFHPLA